MVSLTVILVYVRLRLEVHPCEGIRILHSFRNGFRREFKEATFNCLSSSVPDL